MRKLSSESNWVKLLSIMGNGGVLGGYFLSEYLGRNRPVDREPVRVCAPSFGMWQQDSVRLFQPDKKPENRNLEYSRKKI